MKNKKVYILVFIMMFFFSISGVKAADGLVCYYSSDDTFGIISESGDTYVSGANRQRLTSHFPSACVIGVIKRSAGKYESHLHCKTKDDSDKYYEIKISDFYDNAFGVNAPNWKTVYGFKKNKGVTKCPSTISFETNSFRTLPNPSWEAGAFAFSDKYGCECKTETTMDGTCNHCMTLANNYKVKKSEWQTMKVYKEKLKDVLAGKKVTFDTDNTNPSASTQPPNSNNGQKNDRNQKSVGDIFNYYKVTSDKKVDYGVNGKITCTELLGSDNVKKIHSYLLLFCVAAVVIVVILGASDFIKAIASSDDDALASAGKRIKYRIISVIILLLLPVLVNFVLGMADRNLHFEIVKKNGKTKDISIKLGKASDCDF